jgi:YVTN family beta-propeller protein
MKTFASLLVIAATALAAPPAYKIADKIKVGGEGGWDYVYIDSAAQRLYASHATKAIVIDMAAGKVVGEIADTQGIHGIAIAPDLGRGFTSNGRDNSVTIFDSKTLKVISKVPIPGKNPDSIIYEPVSKRVFTFNLNSHNATVVDSKDGKVVGAFDLGGKPVRGDYVTVCNTGLAPDYSAPSGAGYRFIADFSDPRGGLWAVDAGSESGHPGSPHYNDQIADFDWSWPTQIDRAAIEGLAAIAR